MLPYDAISSVRQMVVMSITLQLRLLVGDKRNSFRGGTACVLYVSGIPPTTRGERWQVSGCRPRTSHAYATYAFLDHVTIGFSIFL